MNADGAGLAVVGRQTVAVPFAVPGEEALVEVTRGGRNAEGKILTLLRKAPQVSPPRCRHFGVCGGCQWQHLPYAAQLQFKTQQVRAQLEPFLRGTTAVIRDAVGADPWEYRNRLQASLALRQDKVVAGYYALGEDRRVINVQECPIQHGENVRLLHAARDAVAELDWPVYDRETGKGLMRGIVAQVGYQSGEAMLVFATTREVPDRMALVRAVRDRVMNLTSLLLSVQPRHTPELLGSLRLLWGRPYLEDELAGIRLRLYASPSVPPNPKALPQWLEAIAHAAGGPQTVADVACEEGLVPVWLASRATKVIGIAPDREAMHRAWETARENGVANAVFYTRSPAGVLAKLRGRGERIDVVVATARGKGTPAAVFAEAAAAGASRAVCAGHSVPLLAQDLRVAREAGFSVTEIQPVDLLPQTSHIHCVATLVR